MKSSLHRHVELAEAASDRIETQRGAGRKIQKRIEYLRGKDQATLPRAAWVSGEELETWRTTGKQQLIEELFGAGSKESLGGRHFGDPNRQAPRMTNTPKTIT